MSKERALGAPFGIGLFSQISQVIGAEATNVINVALTLKSGTKALYKRCALRAYFADAATGAAVVASAPSGGTPAIGTNGGIIPIVAGKYFTLITNAAGLVDINITESGAKTMYLVVEMPDGSLWISNAITFA